MRLKLSSCLLFITSIMFFSCSSVSFIDLNSLKEQLHLKEFPEQKLYPEADALVLSEMHDVSLSIVGNYDIETIEKVQKVVKIYRNIEKYSSVEIFVLSGDIISDLKARTIKPDGSEVVLKSDDFHTIIGGGYDYNFYSDEKTIKFSFPAVEKNCIIEYEYRVIKLYPFVLDMWQIQSSIPKLQNIYRLTAPKILLQSKTQGGAGWTWKYKTYNCYVPRPEYQENSDQGSGSYNQTDSFTWEQNDIPAFEVEPMMPPRSDYLQYIKFAPAHWENWNNVSDWYYNSLFKPELIISDEISNKAKELTKDCTDEADKIISISKFVQSIRYVAIELGQGGLIPSTPQKVLNHKYGDCKDKSILLIGLLKNININAKPVLVLTSDEGHINRSFPSWNFNHMIVKATTKDGKDFWIDPAINHCIPGDLSYQCKNVDVLVLNDDGTSQIETTPNGTFNDNVEDINIKINIADTDSTNLDISIKFKGEYNIEKRQFFAEKTKAEMLKYCKSLISDKYLNAEVKDYAISNIDSSSSDLKLSFIMKVPNPIEKQGDFNFLDIDPFQLSKGWEWLGSDKRKYDIEFDYPYTITKSIEVTIPGNKFQIKNLPPTSSANEGSLYYSKGYELLDKNKFVIKEKFSVTEKNINVKNYLNARKFIDGLKTRQNEKVILTSK
ncbi:MAG: DUF3857 and transglutaminase domain-containing protein [Ignavibacteriaceae bacterium]|nr:DUF3857 and transglutaminase domain-containing protein [Ignavibacteriaceae bacterium]